MPIEDQYKAGICNMGDKEVSVRKKFLLFFSPFVIFFTILCFVNCISVLYWMALILFSFVMMVLFLEIKYRFCILFGFFHLYNFRQLGNLNEVTCKEDQKVDRKSVFRIVLQALFVSVIYSSVIHLLAMTYHA